MNSRRLTEIIVLLFAVVGLSSCSGGDSEGLGGGGDPVADNLPPDPGDAGLQTLEGIDSDDDGVRDDIQRFIALEYPDSAKVRAALTQIAISMQDQLVAGGSKQQSLAAASGTMRAMECLMAIETAMDADAVTDSVRLLQGEILNTGERWNAYGMFDQQMGGEVVASVPLEQHETSCTFDPSTLAD